MVDSVNFEAFIWDWAWINLMIGKILIVSRGCKNVFCVDFLLDFFFNQTSDMLNCLWSFFPLVMCRVVSSYNNHINVVDIFLNIIKSFVQKFDGSIALNASIRLCLDWLGFRESIFDMTTNWKVTDSRGFLSVVKIEVNVG